MLRIEYLHKVYGSGNNITNTAGNMNLFIEQGKFLAIIGKSGLGKVHCLICRENRTI